MQGWKRRIVYVVMFEVLGILVASSVLGMLSGASAATSGLLGVMISTTGVVVNFCTTSGSRRGSGGVRKPRARSGGASCTRSDSRLRS